LAETVLLSPEIESVFQFLETKAGTRRAPDPCFSLILVFKVKDKKNQNKIRETRVPRQKRLLAGGSSIFLKDTNNIRK